MDYSLLVGIHDCTRADESHESPTEGNRPENSDVENSEDCDSGGDRIGYNTPPDSPRCIELQGKEIIPEIDIYAIPSLEGKLIKSFKNFIKTSLSFTDHNEIYFIALIDVLTHYGVKKQVKSCLKTF